MQVSPEELLQIYKTEGVTSKEHLNLNFQQRENVHCHRTNV